MQIIPLLLKEFEQEAQITRKMLTLVSSDNFDWKPHNKSMSMKQLVTHIAELPSWVKTGLTTDGLDFEATPYQPNPVNTNEDLLTLFDRSLKDGKAALSAANDDDLLPNWTMRSGEHIFNVYTKYEITRHCISQTIHHRAQLGVYLRILNIPIPGSYGPSADDMNFK